MADQQERRRFLRLDLNEEVRAVDEHGQTIGLVEKVGAGGMQIRVSPPRTFQPGTRLLINVVEPNKELQQFKVEVRHCEGDVLGVQFLD